MHCLAGKTFSLPPPRAAEAVIGLTVIQVQSTELYEIECPLAGLVCMTRFFLLFFSRSEGLCPLWCSLAAQLVE